MQDQSKGPHEQNEDERPRSYYETACEGKHRHRSKHQAKLERKRLASAQGIPVKLYDVYHCVYCRGYHLGHRTEMSSRYSEDRYKEATA